MLKLHAILVIALASSACADTPHSGTTYRSSTPLGSAPENHTGSLPGAASTMRLSAKNRVVPAYPRVRLSPATLEMLASAPSVYAGQEGRSAHSAAAGVHGVFAQVSGGARKGRATSGVVA